MSRNYRTNEVILLLICGSIAFAGLVQAQDSFSLSVMRSPAASNSIRLTCTNHTVPVSDPQFFLDRTKRVDGLNGFTREGNELTFRIKRELEGNYTCGSLSVQSNSVAIVAKPTSEVNFDPSPPRVYALVQQPQVHLNCAIPPGRLLQRYYVTWYKSDERIYETNPDSMPYMKSDRYSLNPINLSLIINNVQLDDMSDEYHCVLRVLVSTITGTLERYNILDTIDIPLTVLGNFSRISVKITDRYDVVFAIELGVTYMQEVRLSLAYTNATNPMQTKEVVTSIAFRNASNITHIEFGGQVPFKKFSLRVRLMFSDGTFGPYNDVHGEYDINQATECFATVKIEKLPLIIIGVVLGVIIVIMIAIIVIVSVTPYCLKKGKNEVIEAVKEGDCHLSEKMDAILTAITSRRTAPDSGSPVELVDIRAQKALISFVSDSLSAAMENPQIRDEVKKSVAPVVKKYCQDIIN